MGTDLTCTIVRLLRVAGGRYRHTYLRRSREVSSSLYTRDIRSNTRAPPCLPVLFRVNECGSVFGNASEDCFTGAVICSHRTAASLAMGTQPHTCTMDLHKPLSAGGRLVALATKYYERQNKKNGEVFSVDLLRPCVGRRCCYCWLPPKAVH